MTTAYILSILFGSVICGTIGLAIGDLGNKRNGWTGFLLGLCLGPIGWIIVAVLPPGAEKAGDSSKAQFDPLTKYVLLGLAICSMVLIGLLVFGHYVTQF